MLVVPFGFLGVNFWFFEIWKWFCGVQTYFKLEGKMIFDSHVDLNVQLIELNLNYFQTRKIASCHFDENFRKNEIFLKWNILVFCGCAMLLEVSRMYWSAWITVFDLELNIFNNIFNFCNEHAFVTKIDFLSIEGIWKAASSGPRR